MKGRYIFYLKETETGEFVSVSHFTDGANDKV